MVLLTACAHKPAGMRCRNRDATPPSAPGDSLTRQVPGLDTRELLTDYWRRTRGDAPPTSSLVLGVLPHMPGPIRPGVRRPRDGQAGHDEAWRMLCAMKMELNATHEPTVKPYVTSSIRCTTFTKSHSRQAVHHDPTRRHPAVMRHAKGRGDICHTRPAFKTSRIKS